MELKSKAVFDSLESDMNGYMSAQIADYNAYIEYEEKYSKQLFDFMLNFSNKYNNLHNALEDLIKSLYNIAELLKQAKEEKNDFVLNKYSDVMKIFHSRLYTFWNVLIGVCSFVLELQLPRNLDKLKEILRGYPSLSSQLTTGLPPIGRHRKKVLNYFIGGVYGSKKQKEIQQRIP